MLTSLEIRLESEGAINLHMASLFQGALMEMLPSEYAESLHISQLHPYTQYIYKKEDSYYWVINCLDEEAYRLILEGCLQNCRELEIKKHDLKVRLCDRKMTTLSYKELSKSFYMQDSSPYIHVHFVTPTAFKQQGRYVFFPDLRLIYRSLMSKYDAVVKAEQLLDEETLDELAEQSEIVDYRLRSVNFHLEGVRINSFMGDITIRIHGPQTMANFANMLFRFGAYSGVGIKTGIGMGAIRIEGR
ncbi:MAG: CRISPR-associated endoribonuclease Cas6 [Lachnospiraceae bacterium]|nr:CRISPR-associated endoribonuclease Cas6 [Lachnospiraceae bacterium]